MIPSLKDARELEVYAQALQDILKAVIGSNNCAKEYDPLTVNFDDKRIDTYAYNLKSGGRHHPFTDFESVDEVKALMVAEVSKYFVPSPE